MKDFKNEFDWSLWMKVLCFRNQLLDQFQLLDLDFDNAMVLFFDTNSFQHKWNISILLNQKRGSDTNKGSSWIDPLNLLMTRAESENSLKFSFLRLLTGFLNILNAITPAGI